MKRLAMFLCLVPLALAGCTSSSNNSGNNFTPTPPAPKTTPGIYISFQAGNLNTSNEVVYFYGQYVNSGGDQQGPGYFEDHVPEFTESESGVLQRVRQTIDSDGLVTVQYRVLRRDPVTVTFTIYNGTTNDTGVRHQVSQVYNPSR